MLGESLTNPGADFIQPIDLLSIIGNILGKPLSP
jgi:hypothetical protein